jgi:hypothetical protein
MRDLTIVSLKLLGVLGVYWALGVVPQIGMGLSVLYSPSANGIHGGWYFFSRLSSFIVTALFAVVLLTRTKWIALRLNLPSSGGGLTSLSPAQALRVGFVLIGVFVLLEAAPEFVQVLYEASQFGESPGYHRWARIIGAVAKLILAISVIICSRSLADAIFRTHQVA